MPRAMSRRDEQTDNGGASRDDIGNHRGTGKGGCHLGRVSADTAAQAVSEQKARHRASGPGFL